MSNGNSFAISPVELTETVNKTQVNMKAAINGFWATLKNMMRQYADPNEDLVIDGTTIPADQKYSAASTLLFENKISNVENAQTVLLGVYDTMLKLEKSIVQ